MSFKLNYSRNKVYWLCQIGGWTILFLIHIFFYLSLQKLTPQITLILFYFSLFGLMLTHIARVFIIRGNWVRLTVKQILPRILLTAIAMSVILSGIITFLSGLNKGHQNNEMTLVILLGNIFNIVTILLIWFLIYIAIHYLEEYKKSDIERLQWEAAVKDFELKTLKSQLNPHFMFNALNSIRALVEENPERAKETITQLSNIFRYSLRIEKTETVPLEDEMRIVRDYLALEKVRYEERLSYSIHVDEDANKVEIPPMMIQTLVENGIKHGIAKLHDGGKIDINAFVTTGMLSITIKNSGSFSDTDLSNTQGFGVSNTRQRLSIIYGPGAGFKIYEENNNVFVAITIPIEGSSL